jgi:type II secretory pathway pseudopilin PulG
MIEMIIALVVIGVLFAAVLPLVSEMSRSSSRDSTRQSARSDARTNAQLLEADLRAIRAPLRPTGDGEELINVISSLNGGTASLPLPGASWPVMPSATLWGQSTTTDLLFAGPTAVMFWADVMDNPAGAFRTELVRWYLVNGNSAAGACPVGRTWCLIREVRFATGPNAAASNAAYREVLSSGRGAIPPSASCYPGAALATTQATPRVFCFQSQVPANGQYRWNTWTATCNATWTAAAPNPNALTGATSFVTSTLGSTARPGVAAGAPSIVVDHEQQGPISGVRIRPLDRVTTIAAMVPGGGLSNGASDVAVSNVETSIPSRSSAEYRTAIMCGDR